MLKNNNVKKIMVCLMVIGLLILTIKISFAADEDYLEKLNKLPTGEAETIEDGNRPANEPANEPANKPANEPTNKPANAPTETPHAGLEDNSAIIFIAIFAISAVYAYKKVKNYNV